MESGPGIQLDRFRIRQCVRWRYLLLMHQVSLLSLQNLCAPSFFGDELLKSGVEKFRIKNKN
eukprot:1390056-Rhodomonas_salina.1